MIRAPIASAPFLLPRAHPSQTAAYDGRSMLDARHRAFVRSCVDDLGIGVTETAEHAEPRRSLSRRSASAAAADPDAAIVFGLDLHALSLSPGPKLRPTCRIWAAGARYLAPVLPAFFLSTSPGVPDALLLCKDPALRSAGCPRRLADELPGRRPVTVTCVACASHVDASRISNTAAWE